VSWKVGVKVLPHFDGGESAATLGGWQLGVNPYSRAPEAAERFVAFMTSEDAQRALAVGLGYNPTRRALYDDPEVRSAQPLAAELRGIFEHARPRPVTPYYVMFTGILQAELSAAITGMKTPTEALASAQRQIAPLVGGAS